MDREFVNACASGDVAQAQLFLRNGASINAIIPNYCMGLEYSGLSIAIYRNHVPVVQFLLQEGAATDQWVGGTLPLSDALLYGNIECARALLAAGANPLALDEDDFSILHAAIFGGNPDSVSLALEYDRRMSLEDENGNTPLTLANQIMSTTINHLLLTC